MRRFAIVSIGLLTAVAAGAQDLPSGSAAGQILFHTYCAACHGVRADGNGPVAPELSTPPPDLTRLVDRYGLPLPKEKLAAFIDGRTAVAAHGSREMPVWGERFFSGDPELNPNLEGAKRRTIAVIIEYLESIQYQRESRADAARGG
jgi:mono/diheme cytochrome c family protein